MGLCGSKANRTSKASAEIDRVLRVSEDIERGVLKILLLGAGESGKSTLFKQTQIIYNKGFDVEERDSYFQVIGSNILSGLNILIEKTKPNKITDIQESLDILLVIPGTLLSPGLVEHCKLVWNHPAIQETFTNRSAIQVQDNLKYFCENTLEKFSSGKFVPNDDEILHTRHATAGVVEMEFSFERSRILMVDVGGQRNERKKWIHQFDRCHAMLFVAAISEFDQGLWERPGENRLIESLTLFKEILRIPFFRSTHIILFLNKRDLLQEKLKKGRSLKMLFREEYTGEEYSFEDSIEFLKNKFGECNTQAERDIYMHVTCAVDTDNIKKIFKDLMHIILEDTLTEIF